jgi:phosphoribosylformylglycinamidine (FGAM) synthase-like amidotransferase family enzyme
MAANHIQFDRNKDIMRSVVRGAQLLVEGRETLNRALAAIVQMVDNGGATAADFDQFATLGGFTAGDYADANAAAQASYNELASLDAKLNTDASVTNMQSALDQFAAKHGIV